MSEDQFSPVPSEKPRREPRKSRRGLMTPREAADDLGVSPSLIYQIVEERRISHIRVGGKGKRGRIFIEIGALEAFLEANRVEPK